MSAQYALTCGCGKTAPVQIRQAGGTVECVACGTVLDVPKLRELRKLDEIQPAESRPSRTWSGLQGTLFVLGLLALVIAAGASYYTIAYRLKYDATRPDPSSFRFNYDMQDIPLADSWQLWQVYAKKKIESRPTPYHIIAREQVQRLDRWLNVFAVLAIAGVLSMLACIFTGPRK